MVSLWTENVPTHPPALLHRAVGVAVQAGENGAGWHHFVGLVPAVSVTQPGGVALTFLIQDGVQPGQQHRAKTWLTTASFIRHEMEEYRLTPGFKCHV